MSEEKNAGINNPQNKKSIDNKKMNLNEDDFDVKDVEIHTMKKDLAELKNPLKKKIEIKTEDDGKKLGNFSTANNGPFFQQETAKTPEAKEEYTPTISQQKKYSYLDGAKKLPQGIEKMATIPSSTQDKSFSFLEKNEKEKKEIIKTTSEPDEKIIETLKTTKTSESISNTESHGIGKAIAIAIIIVVIIIFGAGGYYFWMTRISNIPQDNTVISELPSEPMPETKEPVIPELSEQNSNYLMIDLANIETKGIREIINDYANKVLETNAIGIFEFLVTDENNTPIKFEDFASMLGLEIPSDILSQIGPDFNLYIYNYGDKTRFGLSVSSENNDQLKPILQKEESQLIQGFVSFYPVDNTAISSTTFQETTYSKAPEAYIKYVNITDSEDMALDYALLNNQLVFGTTKTTAYSIIDRLIKKNSATD